MMAEYPGIGELAHSVRKKLGVSSPPVKPVEALGAYQLSMPTEPLEDILAAAGLPQEKAQKVDAMLDARDCSVFVREGMHDRKKNWGYLHELAHHVIPWHQELLYRCSVLRLPPALQRQFEHEADAFAADVFFFGNDFMKEARELPFGLATPMQLANKRYDVSLHAAFTRYAERNPEKCCLLVSSPVENEGNGGSDLKLRYYTPSKTFSHHIPPGQVLPSESQLGHLFNSGALSSVVEHEVRIGGPNGEIYNANSFTNGYDVFTLIWSPRHLKDSAAR